MEKNAHKCLAEGEVTGHAHRVTADDAQVIGHDDERQLSAPSGTQVTHEEHKTISLPPGDYNISRQLTIDPDTEEARVVTD